MNPDDLDFQPGELVLVRSASEILRTLDAQGTLEGLPFMPEMLPFCGQTFRVFRRAHKTCDTIEWSGLRGMDRTVHLDMLRCDGSAHGGCQAGCLLFWKEAWLKRAPDATALADGPDHDTASSAAAETWLNARASLDDPPRFCCQATELRRATYPLSSLEPKQYLCDVRANGVAGPRVLRGLALALLNRLLRKMKCPTLPRTAGKLTRTPRVELRLMPGDQVEVKSHAEILATLDRQGKNRGLSFDAEMIPYCGGRFRVLRRVETIIDEKTGELRSLPGDCLILEGVICQGLYHRHCPRSTFPYWREIWLRRVE